MNLSELAQYISDDEKAEQVLHEIWVLKRYTTCPFWGENHIGQSGYSSLSATVVTRNEESAGGVSWNV
jgi:hypothetical protein